MWNISESLEGAVCINSLPHIAMDTSNTGSSNSNNQPMITAIDWKPDGEIFVTGASDGIARCWKENGQTSHVLYNENAMPLKKDFSDGAGAQPAPVDTDFISECKWNKDGTALVSVSEKNNVVLWNTEGKLRGQYPGHTDCVTALDWKNNNMFATAAQDGVIKVWDVQSSSAYKTYVAHDSGVK